MIPGSTATRLMSPVVPVSPTNIGTAEVRFLCGWQDAGSAPARDVIACTIANLEARAAAMPVDVTQRFIAHASPSLAALTIYIVTAEDEACCANACDEITRRCSQRGEPGLVFRTS